VLTLSHDLGIQRDSLVFLQKTADDDREWDFHRTF
jgi:hypothetical protein